MSTPPERVDVETQSAARRITAGVLAGGGLLVLLMLALAAAAVSLGWLAGQGSGGFGLGRWLMLESAGGLVAGALGGALCRRIAGGDRGPYMLAGIILTLGLLEAAAILGLAGAARAEVPVWLVLLAPFSGAAGVWVGGRCARAAGPRMRLPRIRVAGSLRWAVPAAVLAGAAAVSRFVVPSFADQPQGRVLATAATFDLTVAFPGLVYVLLVRRRHLPWIALVPALLVGFVVAMVTLPARHQAMLEGVRLLAIPAELALIAYLLVRARRALAASPRGAGDAASQFRAAARRLIGSRVPADILATEAMLLYYGLRRGRRAPEDCRSFTVHREAAYPSLLVGLLLLLVVETLALHALLAAWSATAAWILTGLSAYAVLWLVGDYRAMVARPTRVTATELALRLGIRWEADIPIAWIVRVELLTADRPARARDTLVAALLGQPNLRVQLDRPVEMLGMYGMRKAGRELWLRVDRAPELLAELERLVAGRQAP